MKKEWYNLKNEHLNMMNGAYPSGVSWAALSDPRDPFGNQYVAERVIPNMKIAKFPSKREIGEDGAFPVADVYIGGMAGCNYRDKDVFAGEEDVLVQALTHGRVFYNVWVGDCCTLGQKKLLQHMDLEDFDKPTGYRVNKLTRVALGRVEVPKELEYRLHVIPSVDPSSGSGGTGVRPILQQYLCGG